jgi:hypothetical protein
MDVTKARVVIHKDGGGGVSLAGKSTLELSKEANLRRLKLIDGDTFAWML